MKMNLSTRRERSVAVTILCLFFLPAAIADAATNVDIIKQARSAYYSLQARGFVEFQCSAAPNWETMLQELRKTDPDAANRAIILLNQIHFEVSLGASGGAKVTHNTVTATNDKQEQGLKQVYGGMEQMVQGFFETWTAFVRSTSLPAVDDNYQLQEREGQWVLSYKEEAADIVTIMEKDFAIRELKVNSPDFVSTIQPQFTRTSEGFLLAGYQADYHSKSTANDDTQLQVRITYQEANGLQLPKSLNLGGSYAGSPFAIDVMFSDCKATRH